MHKKSLTVAGIVVGALVVLYFGFEFFLGSIVVAGVNHFAPMLVHTRVHLTTARISPLTGRGTLTGLTVANPAGWASDRAFAMETITVDVVPSSLFGDHLIVNEIVVDKPEFVYETRFVLSNIGELLKNMEGSSSSGNTAQATTKSGQPIRFEVRHFRLEGARVTIGVGSAAVTLPMATIDLKDLGTKEGGITSDQLGLAVMRSITAGVVKTAADAAANLGKTLGADAASKLKSFFGGSH